MTKKKAPNACKKTVRSQKSKSSKGSAAHPAAKSQDVEDI